MKVKILCKNDQTRLMIISLLCISHRTVPVKRIPGRLVYDQKAILRRKWREIDHILNSPPKNFLIYQCLSETVPSGIEKLGKLRKTGRPPYPVCTEVARAVLGDQFIVPWTRQPGKAVEEDNGRILQVYTTNRYQQ
ncbi:hypothetical protein T07_11708 [Trichinella nelsoni]|uniref:Uncharacterized protein n=1 Tax=Trichinella nelsoni TaxID=6336 RepID=A0A0V0SIP3_9BILA|nr:hypothetical protein T07_11708 [Trichinella nelsoni]